MAPPPPVPDSPRSSQSPAPSGPQGDLELELLGLANALYNLGTTVVNDSTKEKDKVGSGKQVGHRVCVFLPASRILRCLNEIFALRNEVVHHLSMIDDMAAHIPTRIPIQIMSDIDNGRNPMHLTKDGLERAATENQFMNGKINAIEVRSQPVIIL